MFRHQKTKQQQKSKKKIRHSSLEICVTILMKTGEEINKKSMKKTKHTMNFVVDFEKNTN